MQYLCVLCVLAPYLLNRYMDMSHTVWFNSKLTERVLSVMRKEDASNAAGTEAGTRVGTEAGTRDLKLVLKLVRVTRVGSGVGIGVGIGVGTYCDYVHIAN